MMDLFKSRGRDHGPCQHCSSALTAAPSGRPSLLRIRKPVFVALLIYAAVLSATVLAGGIGCGMAYKDTKWGLPPPPVVSITPSDPQPSGESEERIQVPTKGIVALDCPAMNDTTQNVTLGFQTWYFNVKCGRDFSPDFEDPVEEQHDQLEERQVPRSSDPSAIDILAIISYSLHDCLSACASWNRNAHRDGCVAVTFNAKFQTISRNFGNCFLKNSTGIELTPEPFGDSIIPYVAGARLLGRGGKS